MKTTKKGKARSRALSSNWPVKASLEESCFVRGQKPKNDDGYFEALTHQIFQAGLNFSLVQNKWPDFQKSFHRFKIERVADYTPRDFDRLLADKRLIRNGRKMESTLHNAQVFLEIREEFGSFRNYLRSFKSDGHPALLKDLAKRFKHVGPSAATWFLWSVAEPVPGLEDFMP